MTKKAARLVPRLRFPEFWSADDWTFVQLNRLATRASRKNRDEKVTRVLTNSAELGVVDQRDYFDREIATQGKLESYCVVELGDYVYNPRISAGAPVGPLSKNTVGTGVMSPLYTVFRFEDDENEFYRHYFKTTGWHSYMRQASSTGARHDRMAIGTEAFMALPLPVSSRCEQQKIANCLGSLDELIAAQGRRVDALKTHKNELRRWLLPQRGESQPRLRFRRFESSGDWICKSLSDLCEIKHGYAFESEFFGAEGDYVLLTPGNFREEGGYRDRGPKQKYYVGEIPLGYVLNFRDLLVAMTEQASGLLGSAVLVPQANRYLHNQRLGLVNGKPGVAWSNDFFFHVFNSDFVREQISASASGAKVRHTSPGRIGLVTCSIPSSVLEQECIAEFLTAADDLIIAATQELDALQTHKQGLMQQMFPPVGGTA